MFCLSGAVHASDLPEDVAPASVSVVDPYDWTGFYLGLQAGYGWSQVDQPRGPIGGPFTTPQPDADGDGWLGGAHVGYNHQFDAILVGLEADIEWTNVEGDDGGGGGLTDAFEFEWMGSVRARLGYAFERFLAYGTGGYAFMHGTSSNNLGASDSATFHGWTAGVGGEYAIGERVSVRAEYRYTDFASETMVIPVPGYGEKIDPDLHSVRLGFSYRF